MNWIVESNLFAILTAAASFISSWAIFKVKLENLEKRIDRIEKTTEANKIAIERRNEEMLGIHRRINALDELKIDAELAGIKTELKHIRALLEKK